MTASTASDAPGPDRATPTVAGVQAALVTLAHQALVDAGLAVERDGAWVRVGQPRLAYDAAANAGRVARNMLVKAGPMVEL